MFICSFANLRYETDEGSYADLKTIQAFIFGGIFMFSSYYVAFYVYYKNGQHLSGRKFHFSKERSVTQVSDQTLFRKNILLHCGR
jgi:hypothetical protein